MGQAKRGMAKATYYAANISKQISSKAIVFNKKHQHGAVPTEKQKDDLFADLIIEVAMAYENKTETRPDDETIKREGQIETYSAA